MKIILFIIENIKKPAVQYFLTILFFAQTYYFVWSEFPDSFIKNNALNSTPVQNAINLVFSHKNVVNEDYDNISSEDFSEEIFKAKKEFDRLISQNINLESLLAEQKLNLKFIDINLSEVWGRNTQLYVDEMTRKYYEELIVKESELKDIVSQKNQIYENQFDSMLANKRVEISEVKFRAATAKSDALEYVLSHAGDFNDPKLISELNTINKKIADIRSQLDINYKKEINIRNNVQELLNKRQKEDLNFWDFTFYSIGISTTTTFGDLVANSRFIRMLVCIQLLLSILILANVTQRFLSKNKNS